jgi:glycosyltransferase involved in cell wall biosynthesis
MILFEKLTFKTADYSIATNESYKEIAIRRGGMDPEKVQVIRSGPKLDRLQILPAEEKYKKGRKFLLGYVGVIGEQEGIDLLLQSLKIIVSNRQDIQLAIIGGGTHVEELKKLCTQLELDDYVDFYGRVSDEVLVGVLNTADVCVNPDKPTEMNNLSTMNKIMEYMALKKPIVQFDLKEGRFSAMEASLYAKDVNDFAEKIVLLIDDAALRNKMGNYGYDRVIKELSWDHESAKLVRFYQIVLQK